MSDLWSVEENRMLSVMESLLNPKRTVKYYFCCIRAKSSAVI